MVTIDTTEETRSSRGVSLEVRTLEPGDHERWNRFVEESPDGTVFHLAQWKSVVETAGRHTTHYLLAEQDDEVAGVLPLAHVRSRLFGNALISTPFCVYGGILASSPQAREALERAACELATRLRVDYLELRNRRRSHPDWPCKELYVTFRKELAADPEENLKAVPRKQRAMVRKGIKGGLTSELERGVDLFFDLYSESVRNLGTPVFPKSLFSSLQREFGDRCEVLAVRNGSAPVAAVLSLYFRDEILPYYGGGSHEARGVAAHDFMYWEVMRRSCERGVRLFDFGRSKRGTGAFRFKKHWGFEPEQLHYEYFLVKATEVPEVNPLNPKYRLLVSTWKRLPLRLSQWIGPYIARNLG